MADTLKLEIVTPDATVYSEDVHMVTLPALDGQIGVLPHHVPLLTQMVPGEMIVRKDGRETFIAVGEGLVLVTGDHVSIVTDMAVAAENIDEAKAEEARQRAAARLRDKISDEEVASVNASLARSLAQLKVKRRRRGAVTWRFPRAPGWRRTTGRGFAGTSWPASRSRRICCRRRSATPRSPACLRRRASTRACSAGSCSGCSAAPDRPPSPSPRRFRC